MIISTVIYGQASTQKIASGRLNIISATTVGPNSFSITGDFTDLTGYTNLDSIGIGDVIYDKNCNRFTVTTITRTPPRMLSMQVLGSSSTLPFKGNAAILDEIRTEFPPQVSGVDANINACIDAHFKRLLRTEINNLELSGGGGGSVDLTGIRDTLDLLLGLTTAPPDTSRLIIYKPAHGFGNIPVVYAPLGFLALDKDLNPASAASINTTHQTFAIDDRGLDSLEIKPYGELFRPGHGYAAGQILYQTNTPGVISTTPGSVADAVALVLDNNYIQLLPGRDEALSTLKRLWIPTPAITTRGGDARAPVDSIIQKVAEFYYSLGLIVDGAILIHSTAAGTSNPTHLGDASESSTPTNVWIFANGLVTRLTHTTIAVNIQATTAGGLGTIPITPATSPTNAQAQAFLDNNYPKLPMPNGTLLYWIGNGTADYPDSLWMVLDDPTNTLRKTILINTREVELTGPVGGDLAGTLPNPTVDGLQGRPVSPIAPVNNQLLAFISGTWTPFTHNFLTAEVDGSITNEGRLGVVDNGTNSSQITTNTNGSNPVNIVVAGNLTSTETPNANGGTITITGSNVPGGPAGGNLGGTYPNPSVVQIQNVPVSATTPLLNYILIFNGTSWVPSAIPPPSGPAGGDLNGTYPNPTVDAIQGFPVSSVTPTPGQVLTVVGGQWLPQSPVSGYSGFQVAGDTGTPQTIGSSQTLIFKGEAGSGISIRTSTEDSVIINLVLPISVFRNIYSVDDTITSLNRFVHLKETLEFRDSATNRTVTGIFINKKTVELGDATTTDWTTFSYGPLASYRGTVGPGLVRLYEDVDNGGNYIHISGPDTLSSNYTVQLPGLPPAVGQILQISAVPTAGIYKSRWVNTSAIEGLNIYNTSDTLTGNRIIYTYNRTLELRNFTNFFGPFSSGFDTILRLHSPDISDEEQTVLLEFKGPTDKSSRWKVFDQSLIFEHEKGYNLAFASDSSKVYFGYDNYDDAPRERAAIRLTKPAASDGPRIEFGTDEDPTLFAGIQGPDNVDEAYVIVLPSTDLEVGGLLRIASETTGPSGIKKYLATVQPGDLEFGDRAYGWHNGGNGTLPTGAPARFNTGSAGVLNPRRTSAGFTTNPTTQNFKTTVDMTDVVIEASGAFSGQGIGRLWIAVNGVVDPMSVVNVSGHTETISGSAVNIQTPFFLRSFDLSIAANSEIQIYWQSDMPGTFSGALTNLTWGIKTQ